MTHIFSIDDEFLINTSDFIGNKAASLIRLKKIGVNIPKTWVIPCMLTHSQPNLSDDLNEFVEMYEGKEHTKFAVRSGMPYSAPGILETKLNVDIFGLKDAIQEVWSSYYSEFSQKYRENNDKPDTGTAVIIQEMVNARFSGVAFTADVNDEENGWRFNPTVEFVYGFGDKLVGGDITPTELSKDSTLGLKVYSVIRAIHDRYGPSDIEWVNSVDDELVFVQQRKLKFNKPHVVELSPEDVGKVIVATGVPIGSQSTVHGIVKYIGNFNPGDVLFIENFRPSYYSKMCNAKAILCTVGGHTCHAAIIARDLGIPAISGIPAINYNINVEVNGANGNVFLSDKTEIAIEVKDDKKRKLDKTRIPKPCIKEGNVPYYVVSLLLRFYCNMDAYNKGIISKGHFDFIVREIAEIFCIYFYTAICCESRYALKNAQKAGNAASGLRKMGIHIPFSCDDIPSRKDFSENNILYPTDIRKAVQITKSIHNLFSNYRWCSSYGGSKWADIAEGLLEYLDGTVSPVLFVDRMFNVEHNGGSAFDKFDWVNSQSNILHRLLSLKLKGHPTDLISILENYVSSNYYGIELERRMDQYRAVTIIPSITIDNTYEQTLKKLIEIKSKEDPSLINYVVAKNSNIVNSNAVPSIEILYDTLKAEYVQGKMKEIESVDIPFDKEDLTLQRTKVASA